MKRFSLLLLCLCAALLTACNDYGAKSEIPISRLARYQVVDLQGDTIAQVEDVLIAADSGQISYALIILERNPFQYGKAAFTDASVPRTAVPWSYFNIDTATAQLQFQKDSSVLYDAPLLRDKPDDLEAGWDADTRAYWQSYLLPGNQQ